MKKLNFKYKDRKEEIKKYYDKYSVVDIETISDVNDKIVDNDIKKEGFENPLEEFYNITAMCTYMIESELYDEYFFNTFDDLLEEYNTGKFDEYFLDVNEDKKLLSEDINAINEYISYDNDKMSYYDSLSEIYTKEANK